MKPTYKELEQQRNEFMYRAFKLATASRMFEGEEYFTPEQQDCLKRIEETRGKWKDRRICCHPSQWLINLEHMDICLICDDWLQKKRKPYCDCGNRKTVEHYDRCVKCWGKVDALTIRGHYATETSEAT